MCHFERGPRTGRMCVSIYVTEAKYSEQCKAFYFSTHFLKSESQKDSSWIREVESLTERALGPDVQARAACLSHLSGTARSSITPASRGLSASTSGRWEERKGHRREEVAGEPIYPQARGE